MRSIVLLGVLVAVASCHDPVIGPDPDGSTSTGTGAGGVGGSGASGGEGGTSSGGSAPGLGYENGSRLRARVVHTEDGAAQFVGWYDKQLEAPCSFQAATDGETRCLPVDGGVGGYFSDNTCTTPIVAVSCATGPKYSTVHQPGTCAAVGEAHRLGTAFTGATVYLGSSGCAPVAATGAWYFDAGIEPPSSFVAGHENVD